MSDEDDDENLGYITESVSEITPAISMQIIIIVLSIIVALIFAAKILFFEKRRNPERPSPEDGLKTMCLYLICVIFITTGLYGAGTAAKIIYMILVVLSIFLLCIALVYVGLNRKAILYKLGAAGPFFDRIFASILIFGSPVFSTLLALFKEGEDIPVIGPWLSSKTTSTSMLSAIFYKYPVMSLKIIIKLIIAAILIPILIIIGIIWCIMTALLAIWSGFVYAYKWITTPAPEGTPTMKDRFKNLFGKKKEGEVDLDEQANPKKTGKLIPDQQDDSNEPANLKKSEKPGTGFFGLFGKPNVGKSIPSTENQILSEDTANPLHPKNVDK
jgi:hypothetical protein